MDIFVLGLLISTVLVISLLIGVNVKDSDAIGLLGLDLFLCILIGMILYPYTTEFENDKERILIDYMNKKIQIDTLTIDNKTNEIVTIKVIEKEENK